MGQHTRKPPKEPYDPDKTGYRNPPKVHQFAKGTSGNPKGRPPGAKGIRTDLKAVLATVRTVEIANRETTGRTQWLMLEALALRGSYGDVRATAQLIPLIIQVLGIEDRDVDANRLSPGDEALLERMLNRWRVGEDAATSKVRPAAKGMPTGEAKTEDKRTRNTLVAKPKAARARPKREREDG